MIWIFNSAIKENQKWTSLFVWSRLSIVRKISGYLIHQNLFETYFIRQIKIRNRDKLPPLSSDLHMVYLQKICSFDLNKIYIMTAMIQQAKILWGGSNSTGVLDDSVSQLPKKSSCFWNNGIKSFDRSLYSSTWKTTVRFYSKKTVQFWPFRPSSLTSRDRRDLAYRTTFGFRDRSLLAFWTVHS